jgi:hypothetical protein
MSISTERKILTASQCCQGLSSPFQVKMQTSGQAGESNLELVLCNTSRTNMSISTVRKNPHSRPVLSGVELTFSSQNANRGSGGRK